LPPEFLHPIFSSSLRDSKSGNGLTEAIQLGQLFFLKHPSAYADWMEDFVRNYRTACEAAGCEPNEALLVPVVEALQRLQAQEDAGGV